MMDYMDTVAGLVGFLLASCVVFVIRWVYLFIKWAVKKIGERNSD